MPWASPNRGTDRGAVWWNPVCACLLRLLTSAKREPAEYTFFGIRAARTYRHEKSEYVFFCFFALLLYIINLVLTTEDDGQKSRAKVDVFSPRRTTNVEKF